MAGRGPNELEQARRAARPGGRRELDPDVAAVGRDALEQADGGRRRIGQAAVRAAHHSHTGCHRGGADVVDAQHLERRGSPDDVDDGVVPADLVEVDLVEGRRCKAASTDGEAAKTDRLAPSPGEAAPPLDGATMARGCDHPVSPPTRAGCRRPRRGGRPRTGAPSPGSESRSSSARTSSASAPASTSEPSAMSPAMPAKQWNHASVGSGAGGGHGRRRAMAQAAP